MPIYEYECSKCKKVFDAYKKLSEAKKSEPCPQCGAVGSKLGISISSARSSKRGSSACGPKGSPFG